MLRKPSEKAIWQPGFLIRMSPTVSRVIWLLMRSWLGPCWTWYWASAVMLYWPWTVVSLLPPSTVVLSDDLI
jgi:hypothetical protein